MNLFLRISICLTGLVLLGAGVLYLVIGNKTGLVLIGFGMLSLMLGNKYVIHIIRKLLFGWQKMTPEKTLEYLNEAIELYPNNDEAWAYKGATLASLGRNDEALNACDKAIEINPNNDEAWAFKSVTLMSLGRNDEALNACDKVIEINPNNANTWFVMGGVRAKLKQYKEAFDAFDKAIAIKPDDNQAVYFKAKACVYAQKGDKEKSLENLSKAISLDVAYKGKAKANEVFKPLWEDEDFKKLTQ